VKEFNFYPGIKQVGFHTDMNRTYETSRIRNNTLELTGVYSDMLIQTQAQKNWSWNRNYNIKYDLTKSIKMDFVAANTALIVEPRGVIQKEDKDWYEAYKDTVSGNIMKMGESTMYNHQFNASYKLPLDKFPLIDFVSSDVKYSSSFRWDRAPFTQDTLGHRIQNSRNLNLNATANFETLYNKVPRLKEVNQGKKDDKKDKGKDANNPDNKDGFGKDLEKKEKKEKINWVDVSLRFLMMVRNANVTYAKNEGMMLPGYNQRAGMLGQNGQFSAPGLGFAFGQQNTDWQGNLTDRNFAVLMSENGYLVNSPYLNNQYTETATTNWSAKASIEPIKYLKIELTANRQDGRNLSSFFRFNPDSMEYQFQSPLETGNFSASINTWSTAFARDDKSNGNMSEPFTQLLAYREVISARLNEESYQLTNPEPTGFYQGYGGTSQDVVIPAFIAAYTGKSPEEVALNPFKTSSQPNWKVSYDGFTKLESVKKYFKQFTVNHQYRSTISANYVTNLNFATDAQGRPSALDANEVPNWIPKQQINTITITESMAPLIGFDMTVKTKKSNDPQVKVEMKRDRTVALGLSNNQVTENRSNSFVIGTGYKFTEIPNPLAKIKGKKFPLKLAKNTSINLRADLTMRDNVTMIRKITEKQNQITAGQTLWSLKTSADMAVSDKLTIRFFYDHQFNKPKISNSFNNTNINTGIAIRFTLNG
jgi:cell surface protein SprA